MTTRDRRGFALPAVIGALTILGILSTAGFFIARQELRVGVASNHSNMAVNIAQMGANEVMANWNGFQLGNITPWDSAVINGTAPGGNWEVRVVNANGYVYRITARGEVTEGGAMWAGANRTLTIVARMLFADINPPGALTTTGDVEITGTATIDGNSGTPSGWGPFCTTVPTDPAAGVVTDGSHTVTISGASATVTGDPPTMSDPTVVADTFQDFGNLTWADLVLLATVEGKVITGLANPITGIQADETGGVCNEATLTNWGNPQNPTAPCGAYFPLIYHGGTGLVEINSNGYGQGILLVEGNLLIRGGFNFYGLIITQGTFETAGAGGTVTGALMAGNDLTLNQTATGSSDIHYSRCAVTRAILNNANLSRARPLATRSWVDLSATMN